MIYQTASLLVLHRIMRSWNQSGQKHAGSPDIAGTLLPAYPLLLLTLALLTFSDLFLLLARRTFKATGLSGGVAHLLAFGLVFTCFVFKAVFSLSDSPELWGRLAEPVATVSQHAPSLVTLARLVYLGIGVSLTYCLLFSDINGPHVQWRRALVALGAGNPPSAPSQPTFSPFGSAISPESSPHRFSSAHPSLRRLSSDSLALRRVAPAPPSLGTGRLALVGGVSTIRPLVVLLTAMQARPGNIPLILLFSCQLRALGHLNLSSSTITLGTVLFAHASYFGLGGTNSISSIDLSNAYNGVASYNVGAVGVLLFISNWAGPIFWSVAGLEILTERALRMPPTSSLATDKEPPDEHHSLSPQQPPSISSSQHTRRSPALQAWEDHIRLLTIFMTFGCTGVMGACLVLRTHLFVWTVFSPKFLYAVAWFVGWHLGVNVLLCGSLLLASPGNRGNG